MILLIDNYDSFTFNLVHFLGDVGGRCEVVRNDRLTVREALARAPEAIVLSPGPCTPNEAGICLDLIKAAAGKIPILGVCLGHQAIGQAFGGEVVRAPRPMHGKLSTISHDGTGILEGVPSPFSATRYHSLIVARDTFPATLIPNAEVEGGDGVIMAMRHRDFPIHGVQFHPESVASEHGHRILANFLAIARFANAPGSDKSARAA
jgi:anthranilate synthase/aminodeoxychorismate synthase-like glutamine amidotransferase